MRQFYGVFFIVYACYHNVSSGRQGLLLEISLRKAKVIIMKITNLKLNAASVGKKMLLVDVTPCYVYANGQRTNEIEGYRYVVVLPEMEFDKLGVKINGEQLIEKPDSYVDVTFEGLDVFIYWRAGTYEVGATATAIKVKERS